MKNLRYNKLKTTLAIPLALSLLLVLFSFAIGWNLVTMLVFWFGVIPVITHYLPRRIFKSIHPLRESLIGLTLFYAIMVFMIYKQYQTDYFQLMMISFAVNIAVILFIEFDRKFNRRLEQTETQS